MKSGARVQVTEQVNTYRTTRKTVKQVVAKLEADGWKVIGVAGAGRTIEYTLSDPRAPGHRRIVKGSALDA